MIKPTAEIAQRISTILVNVINHPLADSISHSIVLPSTVWQGARFEAETW
jgi:hypothetical protein